ncbi:MAG TPA: carboxypeptidase regulatory-like domain-containing protein [Pyrinomonadaceae bacterium]|nr:carboxypeptidase regulatory-like domain-containing protein [Pyrinomonadaceae bacterium]
MIILSAFFAAFVFASDAQAKVVVQKSGNIGIIKGIVRDEAGSPIADAYVSIFRVGTSNLLKQVRSAADGSFLAKILPGTYSILAVAQGFNAVTLAEVEVNRSTELTYGFKLERAGSGNTLPEKLPERKSSKYTLRAAQMQRSIYQANEGKAPADETAAAKTDTDEQNPQDTDEEETESKRRPQTTVETYFAISDEGNYAGLNFARLQTLSENAEIIFIGQSGTNKSAPKRFQVDFKFRPNENHQLRLSGAVAKLGRIKLENQEKSLGQVSFGASDEWKVKEGIILVFGFDYSRFVGAGNDFSISPRLGFQYDINSKTRFRNAYTVQTEERNWQNVVEFEGTEVLFREPAAVQDFVVKNDKPQMNKSRRFEFGIERVLDNKSSVEANVFFDTVDSRGIGIDGVSFDSLGGENFAEFVANQQGAARGARVVYTRRLNGIFSTSAGYAFGNSQKLSEKAISNPANIFEDGFAQTVFGQFDADFNTGTQVRTVFRLSPEATIFAIDPFQGRLAIYDPGLSIKVTQSLPTLGLPIRAEAVIDGRNLFDFQTGIGGEEGSLRLNLQRRNLRGGILVRF